MSMGPRCASPVASHDTKSAWLSRVWSSSPNTQQAPHEAGAGPHGAPVHPQYTLRMRGAGSNSTSGGTAASAPELDVPTFLLGHADAILTTGVRKGEGGGL